jgi:hypothetical protein
MCISKGPTFLCANLWPGWIAIQYKNISVCLLGHYENFQACCLDCRLTWLPDVVMMQVWDTRQISMPLHVPQNMLIILVSLSTLIYSPFITPLEHGGTTAESLTFLTGWNALWKDHILPQLYCLYNQITLKNPITATWFASTNALASSTEVRSLATGPVFFNSQLTISSAVRPPAITLLQIFNYSTVSHTTYIFLHN